MTGYDVTLLGTLTVTDGGRRAVLPWTVQRLIAYLALRERPTGRPHVAAALWPGATGGPRRRQPTLSAVAHPARVPRPDRRRRTAPDDRCGRRRGPAPRDSPRRAAAAPHRRRHPPGLRFDLAADLLPDWDDDWLLVEREHYHQLRLHALEAMANRLTALHRHGEAVVAGLAAVHAEPLRESAHRALIVAHLAAGNRNEAARQYDRCRRVLADELALRPSADLRRLIQSQVDLVG